MKKKTFNKKLNLKKETISNLNKDELSKIKGGHPVTEYCDTGGYTKPGTPCIC